MNLSLTYKLIAKVYDILDLSFFRNQSTSPRKAVNEFLLDSNVKVLDICTGTATNTVGIAENNKNSKVVGIDLSKEMLKIAKKKVEKKGLNNVKLYKMDATKTKFKDESFDVVLISLVLHEIDKKLAEQIILEARRVLKADGQIIIVEWEQPKEFLKKLMFLPICILEPKGFKDFLQLDLKQYFKEYGLYTEVVKYCDYSKVMKLVKNQVVKS